MASQRFCLRWNNHQSNMLSVFDQLLHAETFTDVTLAVEGQLLKAHKMVLSACSPYFQALFVNHQEKHPIVILKDVPYSDMKSLLDFMYRGEVSVDQERLTAFLRVAESLRIKGLTEVNEEKCDIPALTNSLLQQQQQQQQQSPNVPALTPPPQLTRIHPYMQQKRPNSGMPMGGAPPNLLMPLLGNALLQPKRKRGRPRKLSGSSSDALTTVVASPPGEFTPEAAAHPPSNRLGDQLLQGSPEMLEVKMGMDGFQDDTAMSGGEEGGEALLIDEGDDGPQSADTPTPSKDSESAGYKITFADNEHHADSMPIITLEVITSDTQHYSTDGSTSEQRLHSTEISHCYEEKPENILIENTSGVHFLTDDTNILKLELHENEDSERAEANIGTDSLEAALSKSRSDLLEYLLRNDGSVVCKLCGEILQSRTHWYRHKYKLHMMQNLNPSPLFQCEQCLVYFKSRKGYIGHISSRHGEISQTDLEPCPDVPAAQPPDVIITPVQVKQEPTEPDTVLQSTVPNYNTSATVKISTKTQVDRKLQRNTKSSDYVQRDPDWELKRSREEKLVSDIIDRVRRECEAQGAGGAARRGYTRRTTVMNM